MGRRESPSSHLKDKGEIMRIAIGGISHESGTFTTLMTELSDFRVSRESEITQDKFWDTYRNMGIELAPTLTAGCFPHGVIKKEAYIQLRDELLERLKRALPVDGIYLSLHGAMEVEEVGDGESDLIKAIRKLVGSEILISASFDLHGNVAPAVVHRLNLLTALRTAPHRDGVETRHRAISLLIKCIQNKLKPVSVLIKPPLILPGEFAVTEIEPAGSLYKMLEEIDNKAGILTASLFIGFAWADSPYTSTSVIVVAEDKEYHDIALQQAAHLAQSVWDKREEFKPDAKTASIDESISMASAASENGIFISDSGDNVTAGAAGDIPIFLERLLAAKVKDAVVAGIADAEAVRRCQEVGEGGQLTMKIGGKLDRINAKPLEVSGKVIKLDSSTQTTLAVIRVEGVDLILTKERRAFTTLGSFHNIGIDPLKRKMVVVKLGYLFPELRDNAKMSIMALSPGFSDLNMERLPFKRVRRPSFPLDRNFSWQPVEER